MLINNVEVVNVTLSIPITPEEKTMFEALLSDEDSSEKQWVAKAKIIFFNILRRADVDHVEDWDA